MGLIDLCNHTQSSTFSGTRTTSDFETPIMKIASYIDAFCQLPFLYDPFRRDASYVTDGDASSYAGLSTAAESPNGAGSVGQVEYLCLCGYLSQCGINATILRHCFLLPHGAATCILCMCVAKAADLEMNTKQRT